MSVFQLRNCIWFIFFDVGLFHHTFIPLCEIWQRFERSLFKLWVSCQLWQIQDVLICQCAFAFLTLSSFSSQKLTFFRLFYSCLSFRVLLESRLWASFHWEGLIFCHLKNHLSGEDKDETSASSSLGQRKGRKECGGQEVSRMTNRILIVSDHDFFNSL